MFNPLASPKNYWCAEKQDVPNLDPSIQVYIIRACSKTTAEKAKEAWTDFQELCATLSKSDSFSTHYRGSRDEHTLVIHNDFLDDRTRMALAKAKLIPPITPPPPVSDK